MGVAFGHRGSFPGDLIYLSWWLRWLRISLHWGGPGFDPWVGKIPWRREWLSTPVFSPGESSRTEEPGRLQSMGLQRIRHDWVTSLSTFSTVQLSTVQFLTGKTIALTIQTFVGRVMSLLFNTLPRLVTAFLPRSKCLLTSWPQSPSAVILEPKKRKSHYFHLLPLYLTWSNGTRCHELSFF